MRITNHVTPAGACITNLDSMKHYMPCIVCSQRTFSERSLKSGEDYEKNHRKSQFCDTCEVKILFNRLKKYEDLEETGRLIELPCAVGDIVYKIIAQTDTYDGQTYYISTAHNFTLEDLPRIGKTIFLTKEEADAALKTVSKGV